MVGELREGVRRSLALPLLALFLLCYCVFFYGLGDYGLWDPDEGRSALIAKEMVTSGNWLTLTRHGEPYYDKPVLYFWLVAAGLKTLGLSELAVRLPSAVAAALTVGVVLFWGGVSRGFRHGLLAAVILATSMEFAVLGRIGRMDMVFTFFFTAALLSFLQWVREARRKPWIYLFYLFLALAMLTKGPVGIVIPFLIVGGFLALESHWRILWEMRLISGIFIVILITGPWYLAAFFQDPQYIQTFIWNHNILRYVMTEPGIKHPEPVYYFLPILMGGFLPWSLYLPPMVGYFWNRTDEIGREETTFLFVWIVTIFVFFSLARNKLGVYILPAFPPLALLAGNFLDRCLGSEENPRWLRTWILCASLLWLMYLLLLWPLGNLFLSHRYPQYPRLDLPWFPAALLMLLMVAGWHRERRLWAPWIVSLSSLWLILWFYGTKAQGLSDLRGTQRLAQMVNKSATENLRIAAIHGDSFAFYLLYPVQTVSHLSQVEGMLRESRPTIALIKEKHLKEVQRVDPARFFVWQGTPLGSALVANFPPP